jgi:hypothetical protein
MKKKNYEAIADCIQYRLCAKDNHPHEVAKRLADYFAQDNPLFQREKFLKACGIETEAQHVGATYRDCATNAQMKDINSKHYNGCYYCGYTGR